MKIQYKRIDDFNFWKEVSLVKGGEDIKKCIQCGTCTSTCVVQAFYPRFDIRRIIAKIKLGLRKDILHSEEIWFCTRCYLCVARCPRDVKPGDIVTAIQSIALKEGIEEGHGPRHVRAFEDSIKEGGKLNEAKVTVESLGMAGLISQGSLPLRMALKGKAPKYFKKPIEGIDDVRKILAFVGPQK